MMRLIRLAILSWILYNVYLEFGMTITGMFGYMVIVIEIQTISINRLWKIIND
jgi:hypothetical protein